MSTTRKRVSRQSAGNVASTPDTPAETTRPLRSTTGTPPEKPSRSDLLKIAKALEEIDRRKKYRRYEFFEPYEKQAQFFALGTDKRERLLMAGNQLGKSEAGAFEAACHLTGNYPDWWRGRRFDRPVKCWFAGETSLLARDVLQKKLCGEPGVEIDFGAGMIPKELFVEKPSLARGITDAYDTIQVKHKSGGISVGRFKSYEQGRTKFQGETLDFVWLDEEPDMDIYSECLTRVTATKGFVYVTFTPLKGMSDVVMRFLNEASEDRGVVTMTIDDALHIPENERATIIAGYPEHEREARAKGIPMLGSGRIFQIAENMIECDPFEIPGYWAQLWGIDFGINHPFGAAKIAWDRDADCIYLTHCFRMANARPIDHAAAMKPFGPIPVAWPHDGAARDSNLTPLAKLYKDQGLKMLEKHATWPDGSISTESAIQELNERMTTGKFKAFKTCVPFFEEFRLYHRKNGLIVKLRDDILSALFKALMMKRKARIHSDYVAPYRQDTARVKIAAGADTNAWGF